MSDAYDEMVSSSEFWTARAMKAEAQLKKAVARSAELGASLASAHSAMLANADEAGKALARVVELEAICRDVLAEEGPEVCLSEALRARLETAVGPSAPEGDARKGGE